MMNLRRWFSKYVRHLAHRWIPEHVSAPLVGPTVDDLMDYIRKIRPHLKEDYLGSELKSAYLEVTGRSIGDYIVALRKATKSMEPAIDDPISGNRDMSIQFHNPTRITFYDFLVDERNLAMEPLDAWNAFTGAMLDALDVLDTFRSRDDELNHRQYAMLAYSSLWRECFSILTAFAVLARVKLPAYEYAPSKLYPVWFPKG